MVIDGLWIVLLSVIDGINGINGYGRRQGVIC